MPTDMQRDLLRYALPPQRTMARMRLSHFRVVSVLFRSAIDENMFAIGGTAEQRALAEEQEREAKAKAGGTTGIRFIDNYLDSAEAKTGVLCFACSSCDFRSASVSAARWSCACVICCSVRWVVLP